MVASRARTIGASYSASFWFGAFFLALMPTSIGYQDLTALLTQQPSVSQRWREHLIASPFGTIEPATFSYGRPIGTAIPRPVGFELVNFDPDAPAGNAWRFDAPLTTRSSARLEYPTVNRRLKGDRLPLAKPAPAAAPASLPHLQPIDAAPAAAPAPSSSLLPAPALAPKLTLDSGDAADVVPPVAHPAHMPPISPIPTLGIVRPTGMPRQAMPALPRVTASSDPDDASTAADQPPEVPDSREASSPEEQESLAALSFIGDDSAQSSVLTFFGGSSMGAPSGLERWAPGAEPILVSPSSETGMKLAALEGNDNDDGGLGGESLANKDDGTPLESPAQRLQLDGKQRMRAEKCLADAVYFEARGEPLKGQEAVAQVVMNRVFSGYYPHDVCGVVYQNASRHLACQFTFACEGRDLNRIEEPDMWEQAKRIAKDMLDGKIWIAQVGHATHYHAYWVHPSWVHEMTRLYKLGVHTFYRPRAWGDGDDEPVWGKAPATSKADTPADKALSPKAPEADASPVIPNAKLEKTAKL